jgi:aldehyde:ferredoxin oxidoreductase
MIELIGKIARREGVGDVLADGVRRAAKEFGKDANLLALEVKGQEIPMHEPRLKHGLGLGYAVSPTGADHCHNIHDTLYSKVSHFLRDMYPLGILEPLEASDLSEAKVRLFSYETAYRHFMDCALMCYFLPFDRSHMVDIVKSVTGWDTSLWEIMKVGERALNLTRVFNIRSGFDAGDDYLPERFFEPFDGGPLEGVSVDRVKFEKAKMTYYQMMGWTAEDGIPNRAVLAELGISWSHEFLEKGNRAERRHT